MNESTGELVEIEKQCLSRFRQRAGELRAQDPSLSAQFAFCRAVESMPKTLLKYQETRALLQWRGVPALPLR